VVDLWILDGWSNNNSNNNINNNNNNSNSKNNSRNNSRNNYCNVRAAPANAASKASLAEERERATPGINGS
jgi:hypothetical protein